MKKIYIFLILVLGFVLGGCGGNKTTFESYIDKINIPTEVEGELFLPAQVNTDGKHDIYWNSSDNSVIKVSNNNIITRDDGLLYYTTTIKQKSEDIKVTLTMTLEVKELGSTTKDYIIVVLGEKEIEQEDQDVVDLTFLAVNDFHGAVIHKNCGLSVLGNYIINEKNKHKNSTVIISSGDMFQGSAISNMTQGAVMVEAMNEIGFDAMCMGNHEFDWGIDLIKNYNNKTSNPVANFPIICCNIYDKKTNKPVDWCQPYTIVERSGIKVGIIGAMGYGLESSIAQNRIAPFEFMEPVALIQKYTKYLRENKDCDIVVLTIHDNTSGIINHTLADLSGVYQLDAVFNGHTHSTYAGETLGTDNIRMPYVQSGCYGKAVGKIVLTYDKTKNAVIECSAENVRMSPTICDSNEKLDQIIKKYDDITAPIAGEVLGIAGTTIDQPKCARWAVDVIQKYSGCQVGFINNGGIRKGAFPIGMGEEVKVSKIWDIMPFDNKVKTCVMTAYDCVRAYNSYDMLHSGNCYVDGNDNFVLNGKVCDPNELITVAAVDYVFDKPDFPFLGGTNQIDTGDLFRDYLIQAVRDECKGGNKWQCAR